MLSSRDPDAAELSSVNWDGNGSLQKVNIYALRGFRFTLFTEYQSHVMMLAVSPGHTMDSVTRAARGKQAVDRGPSISYERGLFMAACMAEDARDRA